MFSYLHLSEDVCVCVCVCENKTMGVCLCWHVGCVGDIMCEHVSVCVRERQSKRERENDKVILIFQL